MEFAERQFGRGGVMRAIRLNPPSKTVQRSAPRLLPAIVDRSFLPPALGIVETPPSPIFIWLMLTICAFTAAALAWSWLGHIDVIAVSRGKIEPLGHIKVIQPLENGKVLSVPVTEGQEVKAGDVLLQLDQREVEADFQQASKAEIDAKAEAIRRDAAVKMISGGCWNCPVTPAWSDDIPEGARQREEGVLRGDLHEIGSTIANLDDQALEKTATADQTAMSIEAQKHLVKLLNERVDMRNDLIGRTAGSRSNVIDAMQTLWEAESRLVTDIGKQGIDKAALSSIESEKTRTIQAAVADQTRKMADARRTAGLKALERAKAGARLDHMTLRAPVDGFVQNLSITTAGQVVTAGQELLRVVPSGEQLEIQAYVSNEDIGFIRPGQEAIIKIDAFPFTRYGTLTGHVVRVSKDAIPASAANDALIDHSRTTDHDAQALTPTAKPTTDLVFEMGVQLDTAAMRIDNQPIALSPGMSLSVEVKTGSRRILDYVFSPLVDVASTSLHER